MGSRRHAREFALQILFQWDVHGDSGHWLEAFWANRGGAPEVRAFASDIVDGVLAHRQELDKLIESHATNWSLDRMPIVDRNILRLGLYELLWMPEVPARVSVNEAIELAKAYADEEAKRFVNGILDKLLKEDPRLEAKRAELASEESKK